MARSAPEPVRRTAEIEEYTNTLVIHPISHRLTLVFARAGITPNAVSLTGMACGLAAGVCYEHYRQFGAALAGFLLMVTWHVMDGADGQLARLTRTQSEMGKVLDGICDYVTFAAVYLGLAWALHREHGAWVWGVVALAGVSHAVQAASYEAQRQEYEVWGLGKHVAARAAPGTARANLRHGVAGGLLGQYVVLQSLVTGLPAQVRLRLGAARDRSPAPHEAFRDRYRAAFAPAVRQWSVMSANYRTILIFVFAVFQVPLWYFCVEILVFGVLLVGLLRFQHWRMERFLAKEAGLF